MLAAPTVDYQVYGLTLRANRQLPHLLSAPGRSDGPDTVELRFDLGEESCELIRLTYGNRRRALQFAIHPEGDRVWANWLGDRGADSISDAAGLLVGPVLGGLLRLRGTVSLHASVVAIDSRAIVLLAEKGLGKSTLAAATAQRGHAVLSDDIAAIAERAGGIWMAEPGYPRLRLRPATIDAIDDSGAPAFDAGQVFTGLEKRYLKLFEGEAHQSWRFQREPLPLGAIYELHRVPDLLSPVATPVVGAERLTTLLQHQRAAPALLDASTRADELARLSRLAASIPIRRLACPDGLEALPAICRLLVHDATSIAQIN